MWLLPGQLQHLHQAHQFHREADHHLQLHPLVEDLHHHQLPQVEVHLPQDLHLVQLLLLPQGHHLHLQDLHLPHQVEILHLLLVEDLRPHLHQDHHRRQVKSNHILHV